MQILITSEAKATLDHFARQKFPNHTAGKGITQLPCGNFIWNVHPLILLNIMDVSLDGETFSDTIIRILHIDSHGLQ